MTVYDYFLRAYARPAPCLNNPGPLVSGRDGTVAQFAASVRCGIIESLAYQATTCVTLTGLCEHLRELWTGQPARELLDCTPARLLLLHPEIPQEKRHVAELALRAAQAAVSGALASTM